MINYINGIITLGFLMKVCLWYFLHYQTHSPFHTISFPRGIQPWGDPEIWTPQLPWHTFALSLPTPLFHRVLVTGFKNTPGFYRLSLTPEQGLLSVWKVLVLVSEIQVSLLDFEVFSPTLFAGVSWDLSVYQGRTRVKQFKCERAGLSCGID